MATFVSMNMAVALIGNGNVASYLQQSLSKEGVNVDLYARNPRPQERVLSSLDPRSYELILLCVSDDALAEVSRQIPASPALVAHVSGASSLNVLAEKHSRKAIWYPLMSMRADLQLPIEAIPLCLEASREEDLLWLEEWTRGLGGRAYRVNSEQRPFLHLAAVLAHNFSNQLYHLAYTTLQEQQLSLEILQPLLEQSLKSLGQGDPARQQTGPAMRGDRKTIQRHLELLPDEQSRQVYRIMTSSIQKTHEKEL